MSDRIRITSATVTSTIGKRYVVEVTDVQHDQWYTLQVRLDDWLLCTLYVNSNSINERIKTLDRIIEIIEEGRDKSSSVRSYLTLLLELMIGK